MATEVRPKTTLRGPATGLVPYRLSVEQFLKMIRAGVFPETARVELLGGVLAKQMTKHTPHNFTVRRLGGLIRDLVAREWVVSEEKSVAIGRDSRPEPDIALAIGPEDRYRTHDPTAKDLVLIIEVSESTYPADRRDKWRVYAGAKIPSYWVVNLSKRQVEVFTSPAGRGKTARYREARSYGEGDSVPLVIGGRELGTIAVNEFLP